VPAADERGAGVIGTMLGASVFLLLMLFAVQVLVGLYTRSVLTAAAYDAAKAVAGADAGAGGWPASRADAQANAQAQLGAWGRKVTFDWDTCGDVVRLTARGPRPLFLPAALSGPVGLGDVVRTVTVRKEQVIGPDGTPVRVGTGSC
jgi:hypothetical protein